MGGDLGKRGYRESQERKGTEGGLVERRKMTLKEGVGKDGGMCLARVATSDNRQVKMSTRIKGRTEIIASLVGHVFYSLNPTREV